MIEKLDKILVLSQNYIGHLSYLFSNRPFVGFWICESNMNTDFVIGYARKGHKRRAL